MLFYQIYAGQIALNFKMIHLDYFGQTPLRYARVVDAKKTQVFDFLNGVIIDETNNSIKMISTKDNFHLEELNYFLSMLDDSKIKNINSLEMAIEILNIAKG